MSKDFEEQAIDRLARIETILTQLKDDIGKHEKDIAFLKRVVYMALGGIGLIKLFPAIQKWGGHI